MAKTLSNMLELDTPAPDFCLKDVVSHDMVHLKADFPSKIHLATVIMFICNHCPYVKHVNKAIVKLAHDYQNKGVRFIAINANDIKNYPDDAPEHMVKTAQQEGYSFPYLFDETQEVASAYKAACTPDFFIFDENLKLAYRGQLDDSRPGNDIKPDGSSMRVALDSIMIKEPVSIEQRPSMGCNIKWKIQESC